MLNKNENELRVDITMHNNRLHKVIISRYPSVKNFCESLNLGLTEVGKYLNLKKSPMLKGGKGYRKTCRTIADHFFVDVEELFPLELYEIKTTELSFEMSSERLSWHECEQILISDNDPYVEAEKNDLKEKIERILATLTPREEKVVRLYFGLNGSGGEHETGEIGIKFECSSQRITQILLKALRKLRHPSRKGKLSSFLLTD